MYNNETLWEVDYGNVQTAKPAVGEVRRVIPSREAIIKVAVAILMVRELERLTPEPHKGMIRRYLGI